MKIVVVGSVAFDNVETPFGKVENVLGGSATFFSVAASFFAPVSVVAVVGQDFPASELEFLRSRGIDTEGIEIAAGRTFRWTGRYHEDMNLRDTLDLQLNVFADFQPKVPRSYREAEICFLSTIHPGLQKSVLGQLGKPRLVGADTMTHWIQQTRGELEALLADVEVLTVNDEEARLLSGERNVVHAARKILALGPKSVLIKRGEYGVLHFSSDSIFAVPAFPLEQVFDPTGAGDAFAGGFIGSLAKSGDFAAPSVRRAIVYGSVMASFAVEDFSLNRLRALDGDDVERRYRQFVALTEF
ncbi:MAG: sugar kinase [Deltaproteobacteria bacterium]|nr:sugar kinase [Deltaproteobacteria bacterium]